jgi:hypothetical protein
MMITLTNDFHNTSVSVRLNNQFLTKNQESRVYKKLCGIKGCACGNAIGMRGAQTAPIIGQDYSSRGLVPRFNVM